MDEEAPVVFSIKKRGSKPGNRRPRPSFAAAGDDDGAATTDDGGGDEGDSVVIRSSSVKKTAASRLKDKELKRQTSRLSIGGGDLDEGELSAAGDDSFAFTKRRLQREDPVLAGLAQADQQNANQSSSSYSQDMLNQLKQQSEPSTKKRYDDLTLSKFGGRVLDLGPDDDDDDEDAVMKDATTIPTERAIAEAREKRDLLRQNGGGQAINKAEDGYISLQVGFANKGGDSRLVREEDETGDGDMEHAEFTGASERVPLGRVANKAAARKLKEGMVEMIDDAEEDGLEDDEEMRDWEAAQIRRGDVSRYADAERAEESKKQVYEPAKIPAVSAVPTMSDVTARLATALAIVEESHTFDSAQLAHFEKEKAELVEQENELRLEVERNGTKDRFFRDFKDFVEEVAGFLDDKVPKLEKIETEFENVLAERWDIAAKRRWEDESDDVALFTGEKVGGRYVSAAKGKGKATEEQDDEDDEQEDGVDEMGRAKRGSPLDPRSPVRETRRAARLERMTERAPVASDPGGGSGSDEAVGYYTDDELLAADSADLSDALAGLKEQLGALFADVKADEFRDPNLGIRQRFEEWRANHPEEYSNAFGGLALVQVWEFWARVEMVIWNPFDIPHLPKSSKTLELYAWYTSLSAYGRRTIDMGGDEDEVDVDDSESIEVVNALVSSVVVKRLSTLAECSWDPLSRVQNSRALSWVDEVSLCVEPTSPRFETLVLAFLRRFQLVVRQGQSFIEPHLDKVRLPSNAFDPNTFLARQRFLWRYVKLLSNAVRWRKFAKNFRLSAAGDLPGAGRLFDEMLAVELVARTLLPVIEASWQTGGQAVAERIVQILPEGVLPPALARKLLQQQ